MRTPGPGGFTLIDIVTVLVIPMGEVLEGQELITGARVRSLTALMDGVKAACSGFRDRCRALPGDDVQAAPRLRCSGGPWLTGNGDGVIERAASPLAGSGPNSGMVVWTHLTAAGRLNGNSGMTAGDTAATDTDTLKNPFDLYMQVVHGGRYADTLPTPASRHDVKTGSLVPVEIAAEVDRKADDGNGISGSFRYSTYGDAATGGNAPVAPPAPAAAYVTGQCVSDTGMWFVAHGEANCGAASFL